MAIDEKLPIHRQRLASGRFWRRVAIADSHFFTRGILDLQKNKDRFQRRAVRRGYDSAGTQWARMSIRDACLSGRCLKRESVSERLTCDGLHTTDPRQHGIDPVYR